MRAEKCCLKVYVIPSLFRGAPCFIKECTTEFERVGVHWHRQSTKIIQDGTDEIRGINWQHKTKFEGMGAGEASQ